MTFLFLLVFISLAGVIYIFWRSRQMKITCGAINRSEEDGAE